MDSGNRSTSPHSSNDKNYQLRNLMNVGNHCAFQEISSTENPIVIGKIETLQPFIRKSKFQLKSVLLIHISDICRPSPKIWKAVFVEEAAEILNNISLENGDYVLFRRTKLFRNTCCESFNNNEHGMQFIIGQWPISKLEDVYYRRKNMRSWIPLRNTTSYESSGSDVNNSILSRDHPRKRASNEPTTSDMERIRKTFSSIKSNEIGSRSVMCDVGEKLKNTLVSKYGLERKNYNEKTSYEYVNLKNIQRGVRINTYTILEKIVKKPTITASKHYHMIIHVIDDTKTDGIMVHIYANSTNEFPLLQNYSIVRFHRLLLRESRLGFDGYVKNPRDILVFDKNDINIRHNVSKSYTLTEEDVKKAEHLRNWMFKNISAARPFTTLNVLDLTQRKINLNCQIVDIKNYGEPVMVLRVRDGTKCPVPVQQIPFDIESWTEAITAAKPNPDSNGEEVDIITTEPDINFKQLRIGERIELRNVEVMVITSYIKTMSRQYLKIHMKGLWGNIKNLQLHENIFENSDMISSEKPGASSSSSQQPKRKLLNPDTPVVFESDGEDMVDKATEKNVNQNNFNGNVSCTTSCAKRKRNNIHETSTTENNLNLTKKNNTNEIQKEENCIEIKKTKIDSSNDILHNDSLENDALLCQAASSIEKDHNNVCCNTNNDISNENNEVENVGISSEIVIEDVCTILESQPEQCKYITRWSESASNLFNIRVQLIATDPILDEKSNEANVMSIVSFYCNECLRFFPYYEIKWIHPTNDDVLGICPNCQEEDRIREVNYLIMCKLLLRDQNGDVAWSVILGKYAEKFFECNVEQVVSSAEIRTKILNRVCSLLSLFRNKGPVLLVQIAPFNNVENTRFQYHITDIKSCCTSN